MDPSPYEDNYLVHLCFHYVEKYFFFPPLPNILFPSPNHKSSFFFIFKSTDNERRKPQLPPPSAFVWWEMVHESRGGEAGNGAVCRVWKRPWLGNRRGEKQDGGERWHRSQSKDFGRWWAQACMKTRRRNQFSEVQQGTQQGHTRSKAPTTTLHFWKESKGSGKSKGKTRKAEPRDPHRVRALTQDGQGLG